MSEERTVVIFRKFKSDGEVIALFPELQADQQKGHCLSYMRVRQHGAAAWDLTPYTTAANPEEYASLKAELEGIGYILKIQKRITRKWFEVRL
mgnify:CR=1 FL=1